MCFDCLLYFVKKEMSKNWRNWLLNNFTFLPSLVYLEINEGGKEALSAYDGYGPVAQRDGCKSGQFRVYGWTSLGSLLYDHSLTLSTETIKNTELLKVLTTIPLRSVHQHNFITVQVHNIILRNFQN